MNSRSAPRTATRRVPLTPRRPRASGGHVLVLLTASLAATVALVTIAAAAATDSPPSRVFAHGYHVQSDGSDGFEYAIIDPTTSSMTSSAHRDFDSLKRLARGASSEVFWFSLDDKDYLVRDAEWVERAKRIVAPMQELGRRQSELGAQQSTLGQQQSRLGEQQGRIGNRMGELGRRLAAMSVPEAESDDGRDTEPARTEIRQEMESLRGRIEALRTKQEPLADRQRDLGRRQAALGQQQRQASSIASQALEKLARDAVKSGKADRTGD